MNRTPLAPKFSMVQCAPAKAGAYPEETFLCSASGGAAWL